MASINSYRNKWRRWHKSYEKRAYKVLIKTFRKWARDIDFARLTPENYPQIVGNAVRERDLTRNLEDIYIEIGLIHGERIGKGINKQIKLFTLGDFTSVFLDDIIDFLLEFGAEKVVTISATFQDDINRIITQGLEDELTIQEIARDLQTFVNRPGFYRWQALRIARTETTTAANRAALEAGAISGLVTNKVWISSQDSRTRVIPEDSFDHLSMDEVQVGIEEDFRIPEKEGGTEAMAYPGDPKGSAGNVINCRCTVAIIPKTDRQGNLIFTT